MKLWVDDLRKPPRGWTWVRSVNGAKDIILEYSEKLNFDMELEDQIEIISIDHDAGDYACNGGDYIKLLDWLEETGRSYPIHIHSQNPVGVENMRRIIERNGWREIR
jgi:hypothetical protein